MITKKKYYDWFESFGNQSAVLNNFNYKQLNEDYRESIRSGIMDSTIRLPAVNFNNKKRINKFYKTKVKLQNKESIIILNTKYLMLKKYNPYREGDEDYYIKQMHKIWMNESDTKISLPLVEFDYKGKVFVTEGNHRVKAAFITKYTVQRIACKVRYYTREL